MHIRSAHAGTRFLCPLAGASACTSRFSSLGGTRPHVETKHRNNQYPCPCATERGFAMTFTTRNGARQHAQRKHETKTYPCPYAKESNCMSVFKCPESASQHGATHNIKRSYICPGAKEYGCNRSFHSLTGALSHLKVVHQKVRYPCPLSDKYNCNDLFTSQTRAKSHASSAHEKRRFPCPLAEQENCSAIFADKSYAQKHAEIMHNEVLYPCPVAEQFNCQATFQLATKARLHAERHFGTEHPCPLAERYKCELVFNTGSQAAEHAKVHTQPFQCPHRSCGERFETDKEILEHLSDPKHPGQSFFFCSVATCRGSVARVLFSNAAMSYHMGMHIKRGHIGIADKLEPQLAEAQAFSSNVPLFFNMIQYKSIDPEDNDEDNTSPELDNDTEPSYAEPINDGKLDTTDSDEKEQVELVLQFLEQQANCEIDSAALSKKHRQQIAHQNTVKGSARLPGVSQKPRSHLYWPNVLLGWHLPRTMSTEYWSRSRHGVPFTQQEVWYPQTLIGLPLRSLSSLLCVDEGTSYLWPRSWKLK
ncbi:hypothetical protein F5B21DRAFT_112677 [Xylaria acuta]|nr:hypothetical protein F5B21DRAFT_112677 [Xylaria acuta]